MSHSARLFRALACTLLLGLAANAGAVDVPVATLSHNIDGTNWGTNSASILTSLSAENADIMSLQEVFTASTALADLKVAYVDGGTYDYSPGYFDGNTANESPTNITDN